ncbi:hypothetical protein JHK85_056943 [Glycine max]|nr:hypothetical protein JHK85_056943 [Glycine max]
MARNTTCNLNAVPFHAVDPRIGISYPIERRNKEPLLQQLIFLFLLVCAFWLNSICTLSHTLIEPRACMNDSEWKANDSNSVALEKFKRDSVYIDKNGRLRNFNHKKVSRKKCGSLRGRGWKYGSGFVDGIFPVLSPTAQQILDYVEKGVESESIWGSLDMLPPTLDAWDDIFTVAVQLRMRKQWDSIISKKTVQICRWILLRSSFKPDVICYNLLIEAFGQKLLYKEAESTYLQLLEARCIPTEDTYALLIKAYCISGLLEKAEAVFAEMRNYGLPSRKNQEFSSPNSRAGYPYGAAEIFSLMQHMGCEPDRASYNILVDAYGKAGFQDDAEAVFKDMKRVGITPTMKSHMVLLSAYSKMGSVNKCEEILNQMCKSGLKLDTYVLNSMLNLYGRLGQFGKMEEVLRVMEKGSYVADISTYNILINRYGQAGFIERMEDLFQLLPSKGLKPDVVTWTSRIGAYSKKKLYLKCLEIFEEMIDDGCYPDGGTAKVLLAACSNEDQTEQVTTVIRTMHKDMKTVLPV